MDKDYKKLQRRVHVLEQAVQALLERDSDFLHEFSPFNDQAGRLEIFDFLMSSLESDAIVETGTKWGNTTAYFARRFSGSVYSSELIRKTFLIARERLKHYSNVNLMQMDSREFLLKINENKSFEKPFFYLDAHWYEDLPLLEEINIIASNWNHYTILIDDFQVPNDSGYGYDDYGLDKALNFPYIENIVRDNGMDVFFPTLSSEKETGAKRGCCLIGKYPSPEREALDKTSLLRRYNWS